MKISIGVACGQDEVVSAIQRYVERSEARVIEQYGRGVAVRMSIGPLAIGRLHLLAEDGAPRTESSITAVVETPPPISWLRFIWFRKVARMLRDIHLDLKRTDPST